jgi:hypothetical protein
LAAVASLLLGAWLAFAIHCPKCNAKLFWLSIRRRSLGDWLPWLLSLTECPECGLKPPRQLRH